MKRIIIVFVSAILVFSCFTSCGAASKYQIKEVGGFDNRHIADALHKQEIKLETKTEKELFVKNKRDIEYNGTLYNCTYNYTEKSYLFNGEIQNYTFDKDGIIIDFGINKKTGKIDKYFYIDIKYKDKNTNPSKTRDECVQIALDYFGSHVDDINEYTLIEEKYRKIPEYEGVYDFKFARLKNGVKTIDGGNIGVTVYGDVISHLFTKLGDLKNEKMPNEHEFEEIQKNINTKIDKIYKNVITHKTIDFLTEDVIFMKLSDGRRVLQYFIVATSDPENDNEIGFRDQTVLLVYLN